MKTTKKRLTPETVLIIINEIKASIDDGNFLPKNHRPKTPSIYNVLRVLLDKGVVSKKRGIYLWTGGQPNIHMATEVLKINKIYLKESTEQRFIRQENLQKFLDDLNNQNVMQSLDVQEIEYPKEHTIQNNESVVVEMPMTIAEQLTGIIGIDAEIEIQNKLKEEISKLKKDNELFQGFIKNLLNENADLEIELENIKAKKSKSLNQKVEEIKTLPIEKEKPAPRKVKLFGITILKIE